MRKGLVLLSARERPDKGFLEQPQEDHYCVAREGKDPYYFDEEEHLKRLLEDLSEYKRLRKINIKNIEDVFAKGWERLEEDGKLPL